VENSLGNWVWTCCKTEGAVATIRRQYALQTGCDLVLEDGSALSSDGVRHLGKTVTLILMSDLGAPKGLYTKNDWLADSVSVTARLNNRLSENPPHPQTRNA
jgi:hypothetical protein